MRFGEKLGKEFYMDDNHLTGNILWFSTPGSYVVRFVDDLPDWHKFVEVYDSVRQISYPNPFDVDAPGHIDLRADVPEHIRISRRFFANIILLASTSNLSTNRVYVARVPRTIYDMLTSYFRRNGTICDRNFEITRTGAGLNTKYSLVSEERSPFDTSAYQRIDCELILQKMYQRAFPDIEPGDDNETNNQDTDDFLSQNSEQDSSRIKVNIAVNQIEIENNKEQQDDSNISPDNDSDVSNNDNSELVQVEGAVINPHKQRRRRARQKMLDMLTKESGPSFVEKAITELDELDAAAFAKTQIERFLSSIEALDGNENVLNDSDEQNMIKNFAEDAYDAIRETQNGSSMSSNELLAEIYNKPYSNLSSIYRYIYDDDDNNSILSAMAHVAQVTNEDVRRWQDENNGDAVKAYEAFYRDYLESELKSLLVAMKLLA